MDLCCTVYSIIPVILSFVIYLSLLYISFYIVICLVKLVLIPIPSLITRGSSGENAVQQIKLLQSTADDADDVHGTVARSRTAEHKGAGPCLPVRAHAFSTASLTRNLELNLFFFFFPQNANI